MDFKEARGTSALGPEACALLLPAQRALLPAAHPSHVPIKSGVAFLCFHVCAACGAAGISPGFEGTAQCALCPAESCQRLRPVFQYEYFSVRSAKPPNQGAER